MRKALVLMTALILLWPLGVQAQDGKAALENVAKAMGASGLKSIEYSGSGESFMVGQSPVPGAPWPKLTVKSQTRAANYETASLRTEQVINRATDLRGGGAFTVGDTKQVVVVSGDHAWTVAGETPTPQPRFRTEQQLQLWTTPHGVIKAAMANNAKVQGQTISFSVPARFNVKATANGQNLIEKVEAVFSNQVVGDMPVEIVYSDYKDFGGVKFPTKIKQTIGGFPALDLTVTEVKPNAAVDIAVPEPIRQATNPYAKVASQAAAEGVWYITGGSHHSVAIEMKDHVIVVEAPLDEERAIAVLGEVKNLVPTKSVRYVVNSHHHFDHSGGLRAFAAEGVTVITHESSRAFFEKALAAPATVSPDRLTKSGKKGTVEGVKDKKVLTDGTRTVEIHHIAGSIHGDGLLMVYLPKEKLLSQADAFTPPAPNAPPPAVVNPSSVNLADNISKLGLAVDQLLPLHGRMVPLAELNKAIGRAQ
jgi:glyoxylase-like metal-dependent hydrolase (beta-lactamase superfamily II)